MNILPDWGQNSYSNSTLDNFNINQSIPLLSDVIVTLFAQVSNKIKFTQINYDPTGKIPFPKESIYKEIPPNGIDLDDPF